MKTLAIMGATGIMTMGAAAGLLPTVALKPGDVTHGFVVQAVTDLPDVSARMVRLTFEKNGADLVWLARDDDNKSFSIAFKTPPEDNTGVAHILEHSVLCGSDKYPVKEPFVDLLKSSLATFLNATTWPHLTAYPVATRNDKDFANLVDVYLDAVFHPRSVQNDWAWRQEGWHYEFDADGRLVRNGVVYSEMKGAMAGVDRVASRELHRLLFPDNCYGFNSGGDPEHIPELTFAKYKAFYDRHYHPSNARIFLDGKVDLEPTLALLESYLKDFDRAPVRSEIPLQKPVNVARTLPYASPEEDGKVVLRDGWVWGTWENQLESLAMSLVTDYLTDSDAAPLKKALLEAGLCEDVALYTDLDQQMKIVLVVRNTSADKAGACRSAVRAALERVCRDGFETRRLAAKMDNLEFKLREMDTGSYPRGLVLCNNALETWIFGGDPAVPFQLSARFAELRAKLGTDYFADLLRKTVLDNAFHAELTLVPSKTLADERRRAEEEELARIAAGFTPEARAAVEAEAERLKAIQSAPDRPEDLAKLPRLALADIPVQGTFTPRTRTRVAERPVIRSSVAANGVFYLNLGFDVSDLLPEETLDLPFLTALFGELATARYGVLDLHTELEATAGSFGISAGAYRTGTYVTVQLSALEKNAAPALALVREILLGTKFDDAATIASQRKRLRDGMERAVQRSGDHFARLHVAQGFGSMDRADEMLQGITQLRRLQQDATVDLAALAAKVFVRRRLTVGLSDNMSEDFAAQVVAAFPAGEDPEPWSAKISIPRLKTGFEIPANIGFSAAACHLPPEVPFRGSHRVAARIVSLEYLWNAVRVKGGAYGAGMSAGTDGEIFFRSYRDPNPAGAYEAFMGAGRALRDYLTAGNPIEKFQVAAIGKMEPYQTPRAAAETVFEQCLNGRTPADFQRRREEILKTTPAELLAYADLLAHLAVTSRQCVVAGRDILGTCGLDKVEPVVSAPRQERGM